MPSRSAAIGLIALLGTAFGASQFLRTAPAVIAPALRQELGEARERLEPEKRERPLERLRPIAAPHLEAEMAQVLVKPGAPGHVQVIAGLQHRAQPARAPSLDEAAMPAMGAREDVGDRGRLAIGLHAQHETFIGPFHEAKTWRERSSKAIVR